MSVAECLWYHVTMEVKERHVIVERINNVSKSLFLVWPFKEITVQDVHVAHVSTCQQSVLTSSAPHLGFEFQYDLEDRCNSAGCPPFTL